MRGHVRRRCPIPREGVEPCKKNCAHRWAYVIDTPASETQRRKQVWKSGFRTRKEAEAALAVALARGPEGEAKRAKIDVKTYFTDWLAHLDRKPQTLETYTRIVNDRIVPGFGDLRLRDVTATTLRRQYAAWLAEGLSPSTVQLMHQVINKALGDAERAGLVQSNPARKVDAPRKVQHEMHTWTREQVVAFLEHVKDDRLSAMWRLFLATGMRRGEVAALQWTDLDLEARRLSVRRTGYRLDGRWQTGTPKGRGRGATRMLSLDARTVEALRAHQEQQEAERTYMDDLWVEHGLVFCRQDGKPLNPCRIGQALTAHARRAELPHVRLHDLRHTYATLALLAGIHPKVVSERLGHSSIGITLNLYSHVTSGMDKDAADVIAALLEA